MTWNCGHVWAVLGNRTAQNWKHFSNCLFNLTNSFKYCTTLWSMCELKWSSLSAHAVHMTVWKCFMHSNKVSIMLKLVGKACTDKVFLGHCHSPGNWFRHVVLLREIYFLLHYLCSEREHQTKQTKSQINHYTNQQPQPLLDVTLLLTLWNCLHFLSYWYSKCFSHCFSFTLSHTGGRAAICHTRGNLGLMVNNKNQKFSRSSPWFTLNCTRAGDKIWSSRWTL